MALGGGDGDGDGDGEDGGERETTVPDDVSDLGSLASALHQLAGGDDPAPLLAGALIDATYRIEGPIGEGGMGVVYKARDVRLSRDVAIKVGTTVTAEGLARAEREARALARLAHPNVIAVHGVGSVHGRLYIAMELVAGGSARGWLAARPRGWREIVAMFASAGDGLAAAHAANLVHRDVKPDNVLVGADGRPRVADFGLAREAGGAAAAIEASDGDLTQTGAVMGTPAYMAPEQLAGEDVDARADQFAFCASVWEALFGTRPFPGRTPAEIQAQMERGVPARRDRPRRVPRAVIAALERGLRRDRGARWPSMDALLAELRRAGVRRRRGAMAMAIAVAALGATAGVVALRARPEPCSEGGARVAAIWNPARAMQVTRGFAQAGAPESARLVHARIDDYARRWAIAHRDACVATRDHGQAPAILDRRVMCLGHAGAQLDAIVASFVAARRDVVEKAPDALALLPDLAGCADVAALGRQSPLPVDPVRRARIEQIDHLLAELAVADLPGPTPALRATGEAVVAGARATGWPPIVAQAVTVRAVLIADGNDDAAAGEAALEDAARVSIAAGDDAGAAAMMARLAFELAHRDRAADAAHWIEVTRAEWRRIGRPAGLEERILFAEAEQRRAAGDTEGRLTATEAWITAHRRLHDDPAHEAERRVRRAHALFAAGRLVDAEREGDAAFALATSALGEHHPEVAEIATEAAVFAGASGHTDRAVALTRRAVAIDELWFGRDDPRLTHPLDELGIALFEHGDAGEARSVLARALDLAQRARQAPRDLALIESSLGAVEQTLGDAADALAHDFAAERHYREAGTSPIAIAEIENNVAELEYTTGHADAALPRIQAVLATLEAAEDPNDPDLVGTLRLQGRIERSLARLDDAIRSFTRAVAISDHAFGAVNAHSVELRDDLATTLIAAHRARAAIDALAPAMAAVEHDPDVPPASAAATRLALADALWIAGGDHARAIALARAARDGYAALGAAHDPDRRAADAWLQSRR